jgi:hypothetical protein
MLVPPLFHVVGDLVQAVFDLGLKKESDSNTDYHSKNHEGLLLFVLDLRFRSGLGLFCLDVDLDPFFFLHIVPGGNGYRQDGIAEHRIHLILMVFVRRYVVALILDVLQLQAAFEVAYGFFGFEVRRGLRREDQVIALEFEAHVGFGKTCQGELKHHGLVLFHVDVNRGVGVTGIVIPLVGPDECPLAEVMELAGESVLEIFGGAENFVENFPHVGKIVFLHMSSVKSRFALFCVHCSCDAFGLHAPADRSTHLPGILPGPVSYRFRYQHRVSPAFAAGHLLQST